SFQGLAVALKAVPKILENLGHHSMTRLMAHALQLFRQMPKTFQRPSQGRFRISSFGWTDELLKILFQRWVDIDYLFASSPRTPDSTRLRTAWGLGLFKAPADRVAGRSGGTSHQRDSSVSDRLSLRSD